METGISKSYKTEILDIPTSIRQNHLLIRRHTISKTFFLAEFLSELNKHFSYIGNRNRMAEKQKFWILVPKIVFLFFFWKLKSVTHNTMLQCYNELCFECWLCATLLNKKRNNNKWRQPQFYLAHSINTLTSIAISASLIVYIYFRM